MEHADFVSMFANKAQSLRFQCFAQLDPGMSQTNASLIVNDLHPLSSHERSSQFLSVISQTFEISLKRSV